MNKHKLKVEGWSHTCGDGCCHTWGTDVFIDGQKVSQGDFDDIGQIVKDVLDYFGITIDIEE